MDSANTNHWLQIAANVGIIGGLALVGVQLKQNADLLRTQLIYEESNRIVSLETQVVGERGAEVWAKMVDSPADLTLADQRIAEALIWSYVEQVRSMYKLAELGLLDEQEWADRVWSDAGFYFGNLYARSWWRNFADADSTLPQPIIDAINARLAQVPAEHNRSYMRDVMENLEVPGDISPEN